MRTIVGWCFLLFGAEDSSARVNSVEPGVAVSASASRDDAH
jgi:hypothetical protein